ncbi:ATP-grasp domain-containing protein, partial [Arthrospira platensis SPKY1]|nr:ATP-grasp domain-containing protein [Arthrospira platensis SPKY1]
LGTPPNSADFAEVVQALQSPFVAMDLAMRPDGRWHILELDDAQIISLPESADYETIYQHIARYGHG